MPISSEAVTGVFIPVPVPEQNYHREKREDPMVNRTEVNLDGISEIPSVENSLSNATRMKIGALIGVVVLAVIACGVIPAAVILTQNHTATANSSSSSSTILSSLTASTTILSSGSTSSSTTASACPTNTCAYSTWYSLTSSGYYGVEHVDINCTQTLSNITAFIYVQTTVGATYANQYNTFWSGTINQAYSTTSSQITYSWTIISGQTIAASGFPYFVEAQFQLQGTNQTVSSDTYTIITQSACNGQVLTYSGHF